MNEESLIEQALRAASETRCLLAQGGARQESAAVFHSQFGSAPAVIVADEQTFAAVGRHVYDSFRRAGHALADPFVFGPHVSATEECARELQAGIGANALVPVAVGSGTINDLTKLAAHRLNRRYMVVATAASMDGYTAYGASITFRGSKQTFDCPAPRAVVADLDAIAAAPPGLNASGYADLLAKVAAGADWILADALGIEAINPSVWRTVQGLLREWVASPGGIARNDPVCLRRLVYGLMMSGFAMQAARSSRPASGAEHQFSHLWDMQHHTHDGAAPSHGFKVGIGTLASIGLYEELFDRELQRLDVDQAVKAWPALDAVRARITERLGTGELADKAWEETLAKYLSGEGLREQLTRLRALWPDLRLRLQRQLIPFRQVQAMLQEAGCAAEPEQIGIPRERLRMSYEQACYLRRRFTVLDVASRTGLLESAVSSMFSSAGCWGGGRSR